MAEIENPEGQKPADKEGATTPEVKPGTASGMDAFLKNVEGGHPPEAGSPVPPAPETDGIPKQLLAELLNEVMKLPGENVSREKVKAVLAPLFSGKVPDVSPQETVPPPDTAMLVSPAMKKLDEILQKCKQDTSPELEVLGDFSGEEKGEIVSPEKKIAEPAAEPPVEKVEEKPAEPPVAKPAEKAEEKPAEPPVEKAEEKAAEPAAEKPAEGSAASKPGPSVPPAPPSEPEKKTS